MKPQLKEMITYIVITILIIGNIYQVTVTKKLKTKLNSEVSSLEGDISSLEDKINNVESDLEEATSRIDDVDGEIETVQRRLRTGYYNDSYNYHFDY
jgi:peptidoglycan hydrolase CwlO-like protein